MSNLQNLSKECLIVLIRELQAKMAKLPSKRGNGYHDKTKRSAFDFSSFKRRKVAMHLCYIGHSFQGLATQRDTNVNTIEVHDRPFSK